MRKLICISIFSIGICLVLLSNPSKKNQNILSSDYFLLSSDPLYNARNDFDGDGLSDLADIYFDGTNTQFIVRPSSNPSALQTHTFAGQSEFQVSGKWYLDNRYYPAAIKNLGQGIPLEWTFKMPDNSDLTLSFGYPGDLVPNQGDLDCDGRTDIVSTRTNVPGYWERFRVWYIAPSSGGPVIETIFGLDTDKIGIADVDGDGCDELIALRESEYNWFVRKLTDTELNPAPIQWGLPGDNFLLPADINHDGQPDFIITRNEGGKKKAYVRLSHAPIEEVLANNSYSILDLDAPDAVSVAGDFFGRGPELGWVGRNGQSGINLDGSPFTFAWGNANNKVMRPDGTVSEASRGDQVTNIGRAAFHIFNKTWECQAFLASMNNLPDLHIAILWDGPGNPFDGSGDPSCLLSLMNDPRLRTLEIHSINTVCYRNGNCAPYEYLFGESNLNARLGSLEPSIVNKYNAVHAQIKSFLDANLKPWTTCYISPGLEHDYSGAASTNAVALARQGVPQCKVVINPNGANSNQSLSGADFLEKHKLNPTFGGAPGFSNNDGADIDFPSSDSDYSKTVSESNMKKHLLNTSPKAHAVFVWMKEDNCRGESGRKPPRDRVCKNNGRFALAGKLIESVIPKTPATPNPNPGNLSCNVNVNVTDGHSRDFTYNPDNSRKKPKFIFPKSFVSAPDTATLVTSQGDIACNRAYPDEHSNGPRPRWYCEIAVKDTPANVTFVLSHNGQNYCATIPNPQKRYD